MKEKKQETKLWKKVLETDKERINDTLQSMDAEAFAQAVEILEHARKIYIVGLRESLPVAEYLHFSMKKIFDEVILVQSICEQELLEQMIHLNGKDAVLGIGFSGYSMRTLKLLEFANSRQAAVITLTDSVHSPLNLYSACNLIVSTGKDSPMISLTAPMSAANALISVLCRKHPRKVKSYLKLVEQSMEEYQVSGNDDMERRCQSEERHLMRCLGDREGEEQI